MQKLVTFFIIVLIAALAALVTMPQWAIKKPAKVLIGHIPDVPNCWLYYGVDQELFDKYKIDAQLVEFIDYKEALDSLEAGKLDCLFSVPWSLLLTEMLEDQMDVADSTEASTDTLETAGDLPEGGEDTTDVETTLAEEIQVFLSFHSGIEQPYGGIIVREMSKLEKIEDLRRRTVGYLEYPFIEHAALLRRALEQKISKRYVKIEPVDKLEISSLMKENTISGVLVYEPDLAKLIDQGDKKILEEDPISSQVITPYPMFAACISRSFLEERPLVVLNLRTVMEEAFAVEPDDENLRNSLTEHANLSPSHAVKVRLPAFQEFEFIDAQAIQAFADLLVDEGLLVDTVDVEGILFEASE